MDLIWQIPAGLVSLFGAYFLTRSLSTWGMTVQEETLPVAAKPFTIGPARPSGNLEVSNVLIHHNIKGMKWGNSLHSNHQGSLRQSVSYHQKSFASLSEKENRWDLYRRINDLQIEARRQNLEALSDDLFDVLCMINNGTSLSDIKHLIEDLADEYVAVWRNGIHNSREVEMMAENERVFNEAIKAFKGYSGESMPLYKASDL